jgi:hypothetical protein
LVERQDLKVELLFLLLDPNDCLKLRVNAKRPSGGILGEDTILDGQFIRGQSFSTPSGDLDIIGQELLQSEFILVRNVLFAEVFLPFSVDHLLSKLEVEGTAVREEGRAAEAITHELNLVLS